MGAMLFGAFTLSCSQQDDLIDSISENTIEYQYKKNVKQLILSKP